MGQDLRHPILIETDFICIHHLDIPYKCHNPKTNFPYPIHIRIDPINYRYHKIPQIIAVIAHDFSWFPPWVRTPTSSMAWPLASSLWRVATLWAPCPVPHWTRHWRWVWGIPVARRAGGWGAWGYHHHYVYVYVYIYIYLLYTFYHFFWYIRYYRITESIAYCHILPWWS